MGLSLEQIAKAKRAMIAQAKSIFDTRFDEKPMTINEACNKGMIRKEHLKPNVLYHGYSDKCTEAIWNEKLERFVAKITGVSKKLEYFQDFIPTVCSTDVEYQEELTVAQLQKKHQEAILKYEDAERIVREHTKFRDKMLMNLHQMRKRYEDKLKETDLG